jgi:serine/threonine protein kinase
MTLFLFLVMQNYRIKCRIGGGELGQGNAIVNKIQHIASDKVYICKQIPKLNDSTFKNVVREANVIESLEDCPRTPKFVDLFQDAQYYYIIREFCKGSTIKHMKYDTNRVSFVVRNTLIGLWWFHKKSMVHGNINHENVIIDIDDVNIVGFGNSVKEYTNKNKDMVDLANMTYKMLMGDHDGEMDIAQVKNVCARDFIKKCIETNVDATQCMTHDFVWLDKEY